MAVAAQSNSSAQAPIEQSSPNAGQFESLSKRELEVMTLLEQRLSNKEFADEFFVSLDTVKKHLYNIYLKLNISSNSSLFK